MAKFRLAAAAAAALAAILVAQPAAAAQWCVNDPTFNVTTPSGVSMTLHLNVYYQYSVDASAAAHVTIAGLTEVLSGKYDNVTLFAYTPDGPKGWPNKWDGSFAVNYEVTTGQSGAGAVLLHQVSSHSGVWQQMTFVLPYA